MSRAEIRGLLDHGQVYAAHFAGLDNDTGYLLDATGVAPTEEAPGHGVWIRMSLDNHEQIAPNAAALGDPTKTVGAALQDLSWNGLGGFDTQDKVRLWLFTAIHKIGVMELNRPEDTEWNPRDPSGNARLYVSFTNSTRKVGLDQNGVLIKPEEHDLVSFQRPDRLGSIFALEEELVDQPAESRAFKYVMAARGSAGQGPFDFANPDNLVIDATGGVWFGTDGNPGTNRDAAGLRYSDAIYYLDLNPEHRGGARPTYGVAFRVIAGPSDTEATGPYFNPDMTTLFFNAQHPGENVPSSWPQPR
jgi:uncharacterized protein